MKNIKAEFFSMTDAYNAFSAVKNLCVRIEIEPDGRFDRRNNYLSDLNLRHDFFNAGIPAFMSSNMIPPQFNSISWERFGMKDVYGGGHDSVFFNGEDSGFTVLNIEAEDEDLHKLKSKLYSSGAVAVFNA